MCYLNVLKINWKNSSTTIVQAKNNTMLKNKFQILFFYLFENECEKASQILIIINFNIKKLEFWIVDVNITIFIIQNHAFIAHKFKLFKSITLSRFIHFFIFLNSHTRRWFNNQNTLNLLNLKLRVWNYLQRVENTNNAKSYIAKMLEKTKNIENSQLEKKNKMIIKIINLDLKLLLNNKRFLHNNILI